MKKSILSKALICSLLTLALTGCGGGSSDSGSGSGGGQSQADKKVLVVSDSTGRGACAGVRFPELIEKQTGIPVVDLSVGGASAEEGVLRIQDGINQHNPTHVVMYLGLNNASGAGGGTDGAVRSLQAGADVTNANGAIPVIGTLIRVRRSDKENLNTDAISSGIRRIEGARIADIRAATNGSHICSDGFHASASGQMVIADEFSRQIVRP